MKYLRSQKVSLKDKAKLGVQLIEHFSMRAGTENNLPEPITSQLIHPSVFLQFNEIIKERNKLESTQNLTELENNALPDTSLGTSPVNTA